MDTAASARQHSMLNLLGQARNASGNAQLKRVEQGMQAQRAAALLAKVAEGARSLVARSEVLGAKVCVDELEDL